MFRCLFIATSTLLLAQACPDPLMLYEAFSVESLGAAAQAHNDEWFSPRDVNASLFAPASTLIANADGSARIEVGAGDAHRLGAAMTHMRRPAAAMYSNTSRAALHNPAWAARANEFDAYRAALVAMGHYADVRTAFSLEADVRLDSTTATGAIALVVRAINNDTAQLEHAAYVNFGAPPPLDASSAWTPLASLDAMLDGETWYRARVVFSAEERLVTQSAALFDMDANGSLVASTGATHPGAFARLSPTLANFFYYRSYYMSSSDAGIGVAVRGVDGANIKNVRIRRLDSLQPVDVAEPRNDACDAPRRRVVQTLTTASSTPSSTSTNTETSSTPETSSASSVDTSTLASPAATSAVSMPLETQAATRVDQDVDESAVVDAFVGAFAGIALVLAGALAARAYAGRAERRTRRAQARRRSEAHPRSRAASASRSVYGVVQAQPPGYAAPDPAPPPPV